MADERNSGEKIGIGARLRSARVKRENSDAKCSSAAKDVTVTTTVIKQKRKLISENSKSSPLKGKVKKQVNEQEFGLKQKSFENSQSNTNKSRASRNLKHSDERESNSKSTDPVKKKSKKETHQATNAAVGKDSDVTKDTSKPFVDNSLCTHAGSGKLVGSHCSIAGGLYKAVEEAVSLGGLSFGLFVRSQRTWTSKPLESADIEKFKAACKKHNFKPHAILPHGSYLLNCGSPNPEILKKSREALLEELKRCEALGLTLYNFHPGSTCGDIEVEECLNRIADSINWAHSQTNFITTVVENMCCQGNTVGGRFEELKGIISRIKDKSRIGVCLDTCHAFAAGFDLASEEGFEKFVGDFDSIVGFHYLKAMHLNDSKGAVGCHLDRHENIGKGQIGWEGFRRIMQEPRFDGIPMILETPAGDYATEIKNLYKLV